MGIAPEALGDFFDRALVSPVLTAHPTEVRRKSTLTRELEIAALLDERDRAVDPAELAANEEKLRRAVLILWRTNMLRQTRLKVIDEVANGALVLRLHVLPRAAAPLRRDRGQARRDPGAPRAKPIASFLRVGSWIGGDRDGNPFVTADVLSEAMRLQSARALGYYLDELHELGGELSLASNLASMSPELDGARRYVRQFRRRPTQRAIPARDHRHLFAPRQDGARTRPCRRACASRWSTRAPMPRRRSSAPISRSSRNRSGRPTAAIVARGRLRSLRRAVDVFGFHLAPIDLQAELRRPRADRRRDVRRRHRPASTISRLTRTSASRSCCRELRVAAAARLAVHRL